MTKTKHERTPLYKKISGQLREQCAAAAGEMLPSLRQLSADLEVNHATVSRALRDLEREGVVQIVPRKGIFAVARAPMTANIEFVVLVNDKANLLDVALRMSRGIERECRLREARGELVKTTRSLLGETSLPDPQAFVAAARERGTVGLVFLGFGYLEGAPGVAEDEFIAAIAHQMPVVLAGSPHLKLDLDCVYGDPNAQMLEFLARAYERGARRFEYLGDQGDNLLQRERREAFDGFLQARDLGWAWNDLRSSDAARLAEQLRALSDLPDVVVATNVARALSLALEAQRRGLRLPDDPQILCFASVPADAEPLSPYASIVLIDEPEVGASAARLLMERIENGAGAKTRTQRVPAHFSSGPLCQSDANPNAAL